VRLTMPARFLCLLLTFCFCNAVETNWKPVIGVMTQPVVDGTQSFLAASYVKFIESGGGRVVPVPFDAPEENLSFYFNTLNGILFPGGGADLSVDGKYYKAQKFFFDKSIDSFDNGDYFPIWGTCLGFESLVQIVSQNESLISSFPIEDINTPHLLHFCQTPIRSNLFPSLLDKSVDFCGRPPSSPPSSRNLLKQGARLAKPNFEDDIGPSRLFSEGYVIDSLSAEPLAYFNHRQGATVEEWNNNKKLDDFFSILSTTKAQGVDFVSTIEGRKYPVYGVLFHPEKNLHESSSYIEAPSSLGATLISQYFAAFLVNEARRSSHRFPNIQSLRKHLIYRYSPQDTTNDSGAWGFDQTYFFNLTSSSEIFGSQIV